MTTSPTAVATFTDNARSFCAWCEAPKGTDQELLRHEALQQIARVYSAALDLPAVEAPEHFPDPEDIPKAFKQKLFKSFGALPVNYYRVLFNTSVECDDEPVIGDVADDLTDMYCDIRDGLSMLDQGEETGAIWHWRFTFHMHWGRHATEALRALQGDEQP
ncbi:DUF5063 domain-containing protein [Diaphorobacter sp. HDW4A]|uniref:DUF5063 domain-containing protein n=1 Tax=Diaphorobacter sp. HDW4A TaxID=2714924 RepID=UPI00140AB0DC|nr:DUF5063 domain-containing protein [Diaphorobacter sp. HDW4A]QIL80588.1 DUF5063 domain-containing protein [Diaphorobacter sp. HDW4A]